MLPVEAEALRARPVSPRVKERQDRAPRPEGGAPLLLGKILACIGVMAEHSPATPPERPAPTPDIVPTSTPPERPLEPGGPDMLPGSAPAESPLPGLPPEVVPAAMPTEVPPSGPLG